MFVPRVVQIRNKETQQCLDSMGRKAGEKLGLLACHGMGGNQASHVTQRVRPLRGRSLWGRPCSWVRACCFGNGRCHGNEVTRCKAARDPYATCQISSWSDKLWGFFANNAISRRDLDLWPLDLEIGPRGAGVPGTLPTKFGIRMPFRFPSRWRHGTDRQTDRINTWWRLLLGRTAP